MFLHCNLLFVIRAWLVSFVIKSTNYLYLLSTRWLKFVFASFEIYFFLCVSFIFQYCDKKFTNWSALILKMQFNLFNSTLILVFSFLYCCTLYVQCMYRNLTKTNVNSYLKKLVKKLCRREKKHAITFILQLLRIILCDVTSM